MQEVKILDIKESSENELKQMNDIWKRSDLRDVMECISRKDIPDKIKELENDGWVLLSWMGKVYVPEFRGATWKRPDEEGMLEDSISIMMVKNK